MNIFKTIAFILLLFPLEAWSASDAFPPSSDPPEVADYLPSPNNTYYCATTGNNSTGDGSIENPWIDLIGASGTVAAGDLIYFRGGTYPAYSSANFSYSQNRLSTNGTLQNPIVITNYPGEVAQWNSVDTIWSLTLDGDYQKFIGSKVGSSYGIKIVGGLSVRGDNCQVSGVEFVGGTSNGGDGNPAMLSVPLQDGVDNLLISHNYFHDSEFQTLNERMVCVRFFTTSNLIIEYNLFEDNSELYQGGCVYFKDQTDDATIRYNKFINSEGGISYSVQGNHFEGLEAYGNLSYDCKWFIYFINDLGDNDEINIFNNVILSLTSSFLHYLNTDNQSWDEHGDIYDNIVDGPAAEEGWHENSSDLKNLPDLYDYNLWYASADRTAPSGWSWPSGYFTNAITANDAVTYNPTTKTATVADDYAGLGKGRYGGNIGGFTFNTTTSHASGNFSISGQ
jgi:hypothetical protein